MFLAVRLLTPPVLCGAGFLPLCDGAVESSRYATANPVTYHVSPAMSEPAEHRATVAITGAAGGLGACFARKLAARGYGLMLIDRREDALNVLCEELTAQHGVGVEPLAVDLAAEDAMVSLASRLAATPELAILVNNAGYGVSKFFVDAGVEQHLDMIRVHVLAAVRLTHAVLPGMLERERGAVINVASLSAWTPCAGMVSYSSTKAYLTVFTRALHDELRGTGVRIQALCPGFIRTDFHDAPAMKQGFDRGQIPRFMWMTPERVVDYSLRALPGGRPVVIPGWFNRITGRLMQMPISQPVVRALVRQERTLPPTSDPLPTGV